MMISGSRTVSICFLARLEGQLGQFLSTTSVSNRLSRHTYRFSPISSTGIISGMFSICDASNLVQLWHDFLHLFMILFIALHFTMKFDIFLIYIFDFITFYSILLFITKLVNSVIVTDMCLHFLSCLSSDQ